MLKFAALELHCWAPITGVGWRFEEGLPASLTVVSTVGSGLGVLVVYLRVCRSIGGMELEAAHARGSFVARRPGRGQ